MKDKGRRDYTLNPTPRGPTNGVQFTTEDLSAGKKNVALVSHRSSPKIVLGSILVAIVLLFRRGLTPALTEGVAEIVRRGAGAAVTRS